jgi:amidase
LHGTMDEHSVDVLIAPTCGPAWPIAPKDNFCGGLCSALAAVAGGPLITLPAGNWQGRLPLGVTLMGRRFSEEILLEVASVLEARLPKPCSPHFVPTIGERVEGAGP